MISGQSVIKKSSGVLSTNIDQEAVVLGIKSGNYFGFNEIGTKIWEKIEKPILVDDLISEFTTTYLDESKNISKDIVDFLSNLHEKGLIELVDENNQGKS